MKVELTITIDLGDGFINQNDIDERAWLFKKVLTKDDLILHSNEINDELGKIIKVENVKQLFE